MARSLHIRRSIIALILGTILAACGSSSSAVTPQPEGALPATSPVAATVVATPAANGTPVPSDADMAATIVAAPASP